MEIGTTADFLRENATSKLKNVVLLHLSDKNSDEKLFKEIVAKEVPETTKIYVADRGMEIVL
jgi:phosphoribosyl 1,2-cyclic phosphodiesterase